MHYPKEKYTRIQPGNYDQPFDAQSPGHLRTIQERLKIFNAIYEKLRAVDDYLNIGILIGAAGCCCASWTIAVAGFSFAASQYYRRIKVYAEYIHTRDVLVELYAWCMEMPEQRAANIYSSFMREFITAIGPLTGEKIPLWTEEDRDDSQKVYAIEKIPEAFKRTMDTLENQSYRYSWTFTFYGKGSKLDGMQQSVVLRNYKQENEHNAVKPHQP